MSILRSRVPEKWVRELIQKMGDLRIVGQCLSNAAHNLRVQDTISENEKASLDRLYKEWDIKKVAYLETAHKIAKKLNINNY